MKKNYIIKLMFLVISFSYSQKQELGKVTLEELNQKQHKIDTSAVASVIFNKGVSFFEYSQDNGFQLVTEVETKIKIHKKEGLEFGNFGVNYFKNGSGEQSVNFSKAITYNLENGVIIKSKLKSENEFKENVSENRLIKKIAMPNVKIGSVIEYKYTIKSPFITTFPEWNFQKTIPVDYSEFITKIPEYFTYNKYLKGFLNIKQTEGKNNKSITLNYKSLSTLGARGYNNSSETINYLETETNNKIENVPALKEEGYVNNIDNYTSSIQYELAKKEFPNTLMELFATTWEAVSKKIYEDDDFGAQLNKNNYFEDDLKNLLVNSATDNQKTIAIYNFVKNRMTWNKINSYYCEKGVKKAYQEKSGNAAEINLILTAMLRFAGLNSNPILLSTRSNGIALFPSRTAYNYVISSVILDDNNTVLLDATNKFSMPDLLPTRDLNWFGRLIKKDGTNEDIDLSLKIVSNDVTNLFVKIDEKGSVNGKIREQYFDYNAFKFRDNFSEISKDNYLERLEKEYLGLEIENYQRSNETELDKPIAEQYDIKISNSIENIGNKIYFSPLFHLARKINPFTQEIRTYPIDFTYPYQDKFVIVVSIPQGYSVESIPKEETFNLDNDLGSFSYKISLNENQIQAVIVMRIETAIVSPKDYPNLKLFFKNVIAKENEKIVLKKS